MEDRQGPCGKDDVGQEEEGVGKIDVEDAPQDEHKKAKEVDVEVIAFFEAIGEFVDLEEDEHPRAEGDRVGKKAEEGGKDACKEEGEGDDRPA